MILINGECCPWAATFVYHYQVDQVLDQLTKKHPIIASIVVIIIVTILTEVPIQPIRNILSPVIGRFYGDYVTDLILNAFGAICLLVAVAKVGLAGKLGLKKPRSWTSLLLVWPVVLLALLSGSEVVLGEILIVFDPILFMIFVFLYLSIGLFEELVFRGYVQGFLMRRWGNNYRGILLSVLLTNLIFGGAHLVNLIMGRGTPLYAVTQFVYASFFGVFFSALYIRSESLLTGVFLHMFYDFGQPRRIYARGAAEIRDCSEYNTRRCYCRHRYYLAIVTLRTVLPAQIKGTDSACGRTGSVDRTPRASRRNLLGRTAQNRFPLLLTTVPRQVKRDNFVD